MVSKQTIFIIEDDYHIRHLIETILKDNGYITSSTDSAETALKKLSTLKPSLIIIDFQLPGMDGIACCKKIRTDSALKEIPVILISVHDSEVYKITALEAGADDFVTKPFSQGELLARIKAVIRRSNRPESQASRLVKDGRFSMDLDSRTATLDGKTLILRPKEFSILELFLKSEGKVLNRDALSHQVWEHENFQNSRTIDVHIGRLRKKLGKYGKVIQTVGKMGYRYMSQGKR